MNEYIPDILFVLCTEKILIKSKYPKSKISFNTPFYNDISK